jgi:putative hydrolase of the HAD superfamily
VTTGGIEAVIFDFGGVIADGPFETFQEYERVNGLPHGFIRSLNTTNPHDNAWARLERSEIGFDEFCDTFEKEAREAGGVVDSRTLFAMLSGSLRPEMVEAVRRCAKRFKTALLTNNFVLGDDPGPMHSSEFADLREVFDVVIESSVVGVRKPDPRIYSLVCDALGTEARHVVFLDDLGVNLKPARALGMVTIKVENVSRALSELETVLGLALR